MTKVKGFFVERKKYVSTFTLNLLYSDGMNYHPPIEVERGDDNSMFFATDLHKLELVYLKLHCT